MELQVLVVEDDQDYLKSYAEDFPDFFKERQIEAKFYFIDNFDEAFSRSQDPLHRYDLIISDTYRGETAAGDAAVIQIVNEYRKKKFCPLVIFSSGVKPADLDESPFLIWADKGKDQDIERAISELLDLGIPQLASVLHDEINSYASEYLWGFLNDNWGQIKDHVSEDGTLLNRLIRRRAAVQIADTISDGAGRVEAISEVDGLEYYIYPHLHMNGYRLGEILRSKNDPNDIRVVLTPHCHLVQQGQQPPRAEMILTVRTVTTQDVLGEKLDNEKHKTPQQRNEAKLRRWVTPPSRDEVGKPEGRYWYLPGFLEIPHSYCDFQRLESIEYKRLRADYTTIALLASPYGESMQNCFSKYYSAVGIPNLRPQSLTSFFD